MTMLRRRPRSPVRQIVVFLGTSYALALGLAVALPRSGMLPFLTVAVPLVAVVVTVQLTVPAGRRRAVWSEVGFRPRGTRALLVAVVGPAAVLGLSYGAAAAAGVIQLPGVSAALGPAILNLALSCVIATVILLGEEIGWRGYLFIRFAEVLPARQAAVLTGACQAVFHLPLLLIGTTYQSTGSRWIVVPTVMVTITMAGVWYAWLRLRAGSIWAVSLSHATFNNVAAALTAVAVPTSQAAMAYATTETGAATMILLVAAAAYLLTRKAADFAVPGPGRLALLPASPQHVHADASRPTNRSPLVRASGRPS